MNDILRSQEDYITIMASVSELILLKEGTEKPRQAVSAVVSGAEVYLPLKGLVDLDKELARLDKELKDLDKEVARLEGKLNNAGFVSKAPLEVVEKERAKLDDYLMKREAVSARISILR